MLRDSRNGGQKAERRDKTLAKAKRQIPHASDAMVHTVACGDHTEWCANVRVRSGNTQFLWTGDWVAASLHIRWGTRCTHTQHTRYQRPTGITANRKEDKFRVVLRAAAHMRALAREGAACGASVRWCTDVDSDVCKCRCRMSTGFPANVDGNVEKSSIYHGKKAEKKHNHMLEKCRIICWYIYIHIYIYIYTQKHTHPQKGSFFKVFHEKKCKKWETDSKKCQCRLKRPANVEHMSMSMVPPNVDPIWSTFVHPLIREAVVSL